MSLPQVTLVDITGRPITACDQGDAASWPASNLADGWHWELPPDEMAELEAAEVERLTDLHDAPPDEWPTEAEIAEYEAEVEDDRWLHVLEATRNFYRTHGSFGDWVRREGGERDAFGNWHNA
jgi:hypothetical protein